MTPNNTPTKRSETVENEPGWIRYDWTSVGEPSTALIEAVAKATDRDPLAMPPLYDHVDAEALDKLLTGADDAADTVDVSFTYDGMTVHLDSDGWIDVKTEP